MAGIEAVTQQISPINPANLIGLASPVVEPRATSALTDAFRNGVVTASDIVERFGAVGKSADAAKVMAAREAVSPESQAQRAATQQAQTVQAQQATRRAQFPGTAAFDLLGPGAGVEMPLKPDGTPDTAKENQIGTHLAAWDSTRKAAAAEEKGLIQHIDKATNTVLWLEPGGGPVSPARLNQLRKDARMSFQEYIQKFPGIASSIFPGAGQSTEVTATPVEAAPIEVTPVIRANLANKFGADAIGPMSDRDVSRLFQAEREAAVAPPEVTARPAVQVAGQPTELGFALGPAPVEVEPKIKSTAEQDKAKLAMARFAESNDMQSALAKAGYDPTSIGSWYNSILPQIIKSGNQKMYESAKSAWAQGLLRLESGAAISAQEKEWYEKSFFPQVADTAAIVSAKEKLRHTTEQMVSEIARLGGETPETIALADRLFQQASALGKLSGVSPKETTGGGAGPVIEVSPGRRIQRDASGQYRIVQ